ncbi:MAG: hypothetical protein A2W93_10075 [Bacteroidetes bacterium GWF2_43_63]|nr:MAG: hypothetical protein A2W94_02395 [Bacteroidetes bacterium GWE2_42_42]OFY52870.1 MAG: hypothetical protein A2W93_10075 [Bacteroidetes bacterium GWF2_43_63]HBG70075.1 hypothetical protein [Bacteroidales bacterium]HCB62318.1 hypothetical protein [Bacteroidales bacterium]
MSAAKVIFYPSKVLSNGESPILLRITIDRKRVYKATPFSCTKEIWDIISNRKPKKNDPKKRIPKNDILKVEQIKIFISELETKALKAEVQCRADSIPLTHEHLLNMIFPKTTNEWVFEYLQSRISDLKKTNNLGNADVYNNLFRELKSFRNGKDLKFTDINVRMINDFEQFFREKNLKESSISTHMRTFRALINRAIDEEICPKNSYPFAKYKIQKLKPTARKIAISKADMTRIDSLQFDNNDHLFHTKNYFLFSYYLRGINFIDLANLKWENIIDGRVSYVRAKTGKLYTILLLEPALEIIEYYKRYNSDSKYIFPILDEKIHMTEQSKRNRVGKIRTRVNKELKEIAHMAGVRGDITTYVSRHSWATIMKYERVPVEIIQQGMGHKDSKTTEIYLKDFEDEIMDKASKAALLK